MGNVNVPIAAPLVNGEPLGGQKTAVMGILNVTPDSFSDGGKWQSPKAALDHGLRMADEGALVIDVGGESTRPGATRVTAEAEWERIGSVIASLVKRGVTVSVDTVNAETAKRAAGEGAVLINDVSGGSVDPQMAAVVASAGVCMVVQHWRGFPSEKDLNTTYSEVASQTLAELDAQVQKVLAAGVPKSALILDPGLGFAKDIEDSWKIVDQLDRFTASHLPVLIGASRKRFIAARYNKSEWDRGTLEVTKRAVAAGAWGVRVHSVSENVRLIDTIREVSKVVSGGADG